MTPQAQAIKEKIDKLDYIKNLKLLCIKGQSEMATHRMGENTCKSYI